MKRKKWILPIGCLLALLVSGCSAAVTVPETGAGETEVIQAEAGEERESGPVSSGREVEVRKGKKVREKEKVTEVAVFERSESGVKAGISLPFAEGIREGLMPETVGSKEEDLRSENGTSEKENPETEDQRSFVGISAKEDPKSASPALSKKSSSQAARPSAFKPAETTAAGETPQSERNAPAASGTVLPVPEETPVPTEAPIPAETIPVPSLEETVPAPPETEAAIKETVPKGPYDYAFDIGTIQADGVSIGRSMGYAWDASLTPNNASWWNPVTASQNNQGVALRQSLENYIRFHTAEHLASYGMEPITAFHIYCEPRGNGEYSIYFLFV